MVDPQEVNVGDEGIWINIGGKSVKVYIEDGELRVDVYPDTHGSGDPEDTLSVPL